MADRDCVALMEVSRKAILAEGVISAREYNEAVIRHKLGQILVVSGYGSGLLAEPSDIEDKERERVESVERRLATNGHFGAVEQMFSVFFLKSSKIRTDDVPRWVESGGCTVARKILQSCSSDLLLKIVTYTVTDMWNRNHTAFPPSFVADIMTVLLNRIIEIKHSAADSRENQLAEAMLLAIGSFTSPCDYWHDALVQKKMDVERFHQLVCSIGDTFDGTNFTDRHAESSELVYWSLGNIATLNLYAADMRESLPGLMKKFATRVVFKLQFVESLLSSNDENALRNMTRFLCNVVLSDPVMFTRVSLRPRVVGLVHACIGAMRKGQDSRVTLLSAVRCLAALHSMFDHDVTFSVAKLVLQSHGQDAVVKGRDVLKQLGESIPRALERLVQVMEKMDTRRYRQWHRKGAHLLALCRPVAEERPAKQELLKAVEMDAIHEEALRQQRRHGNASKNDEDAEKARVESETNEETSPWRTDIVRAENTETYSVVDESRRFAEMVESNVALVETMRDDLGVNLSPLSAIDADLTASLCTEKMHAFFNAEGDDANLLILSFCGPATVTGSWQLAYDSTVSFEAVNRVWQTSKARKRSALLLLLLDHSHAGTWIDRARGAAFSAAGIVIQTSCGARETATSRHFFKYWTETQRCGQDAIPGFMERLRTTNRQTPEMLVPWPPVEGGNIIALSSDGNDEKTITSVLYLMPIVYVDVPTVMTAFNAGRALWEGIEVEARVEEHVWKKAIALDKHLTHRSVLRLRVSSSGEVLLLPPRHVRIRWSSTVKLPLPRQAAQSELKLSDTSPTTKAVSTFDRQVVDYFRTVPPFDVLTRNALFRIVESLDVQRFDREQAIYTEGHAANALYVVFSGSVALRKGFDDRNQVVVRKGEYFGEEDLILQSKSRSSRAIALSAVEAYVVPYFPALESAMPWIRRDLVKTAQSRRAVEGPQSKRRS